ncbi:MAG: (2Fe-2S) ferredoxin domain-containing protein [Pseudanabaenaceae cyanobacterium bins.39]|nr:(2Fe-2S) ferredoxin domain-containing protein [Pseudanabaenaceae cyanobacterium bins.39]
MGDPVRQVLICQHRTCKKDGSEAILAIFKQQAIANSLTNVSVEACGCLGLCGSGPMVVIIPDNLYYWRVTPTIAQAIINSHLIDDRPLTHLLHPRLHQL